MSDVVRTGPTRFIAWCLSTTLLVIVVSALPEHHGLALSSVLLCAALLAHAGVSKPGDSGPLLLFALTSFVFIWSRPLLASVSTQFDLDVIEVLGGISVSPAAKRAYLGAVNSVMIAFATTTIFTWTSESRSGRPAVDPSAARSEQPVKRPSGFWSACFAIGAIASILQAALYVRYFLQGGSYFDLYILGKEAVTFPGLSTLCSLLFYGYVGGLTYSSGTDDKKKRWAVLFAVLSMIGLARGSRGEVFAQLLVGIWLYFFATNKSPSLKFWGVLLVSLVVLAEGVSALRTGIAVTDRDDSVLELLGWFVFSQGASGELLAAVHDSFGVDPVNIRFIFAPLLGPIRQAIDPSFGTQTDSYGQASGLLAHELSFRVDPTLYLSGHGTGSSYIAEAYAAFGLVGVVVATGALVWFLQSIPRRARASRTVQFLLASILPYVVFTPRESLLFFAAPVLKSLLVLGLYKRYDKARHGGCPDLQSSAAT